MILSSQTDPNDVTQMLEFYKQHFDVVELVSCSACGSFLCFECLGSDGMGLQPNELGKYIIPIGENLLSHRVRLDEAPTGERMVGYQCGAPVPNPEYPQARAKFEQEKEDYETQYAKDVTKAEKAYAKLLAAAKKRGDAEEPVYVAPAYQPPMMPPVPEQIPCGNDTRISTVERGLVPVGGVQTSLSPFEKHNIREKIRADKKHKPDFRKVGNIKHFESFQVERIV